VTAAKPISALAALLATLALAACGQSARADPVDPRLAGIDSWAFAISAENLDRDIASGRYDPFDLVVIDGEDASTANVAALHESDKVVLAYLSVGTIEKGRSWYRCAKPYRLDFWGDWGEWYAKLKAKGYRELIRERVAPKMLDKGFDGLFLDNVDMIETHPGQVAGMGRLVAELSADVHERDGFLFTQNGEEVIDPLLPLLDGWNREDVSWTYDFDRGRYKRRSAGATERAQAALRRISGEGLLVTATDYVKKDDLAAVEESIANACSAGALPYVSNISLTRVPDHAYVCP
jgi:uncharacterized protein (TIGR01370 family)